MAEFSQGYAVIIGVGQDLPATVQDAQDVRDVLVNQAHCGYPKEQVKLLTNEKATKAEVLKALEWLAAEAKGEEATAILYFSGHGTDAKDGFHLLPNGYSYPDGLAETAISYQELLGCTQKVKAGKFLMLLDCCYAGGQGQAKKKAPGEPVIKSANMPTDVAQKLGMGAGRVFIASSTSKQSSLIYHGMTNSVFTHYLVAGLKDESRTSPDAFVHVLDLWRSVSKGVTQHTKKAQQPELHTSALLDESGFPLAWHSGGQMKAPVPVAPPAPVTTLDPVALAAAKEQEAELEALITAIKGRLVFENGLNLALMQMRLTDATNKLAAVKRRISEAM